LTWDGDYLSIQDAYSSKAGVQPFLQGDFFEGTIVANHTHGDLDDTGGFPHPQVPLIPGIQGDYAEGLFYPEKRSGEGLIATLTFKVKAAAPRTTITFDFDGEHLRETLVSLYPEGNTVRPTVTDIDIPLPVSLSVFDAVWVPEGVLVRWIAEMEQSNLGWDIFRSEEPSGKYVKINPSIIKSAGDSANPIEYVYLDEEAVNGKTYYYYIEAVDFFGRRGRSSVIMVSKEKPSKEKSVIENLSKEKSVMKPSFPALLRNYPNPFNPQTWLPFQLTAPSKVTIRIYNLYGHLVKVLDLGYREAGFYIDKNKSAYWDGTDETGKLVAAGVYFYRLDADRFSAIRRMVLLK
jgi:hypothetical protein